ncbi:MAG: PIN domain-containing protein [Prevotellaceae bacterium]|jgi:predicted nucleic acid-binding protein|nr:PIN domain-containing protein [Prevotellaceae bacterium]
MMKALIDTNVVVDAVLYRHPFYGAAVAIMQKVHEGKLQGFISASAATDIFYLLQKAMGQKQATDTLENLLTSIDVLPVAAADIYSALAWRWDDFEDAVQARVALQNKMDVIVTRNVKDYGGIEHVKSITVLSPPDLIRSLR